MKRYIALVRYKEGDRMRYDFQNVFADSFVDAEGEAISRYPFEIEVRSLRIDDNIIKVNLLNMMFARLKLLIR